ncbi:DegT/DnrJ/EryC1/StrS family aminotransferase [Alsobacter sp. R-9]
MNASPNAQPIAFIDLAAQKQRIGARVEAAIARVLEHGQYIMGPEVKAFEAQLGALCGAKEVVSCASGTDALALVLMARGVRPGDAIFCPSFTFCATAEVVAWLGATPVFVDSDPRTFNMSPENLRQALATARGLGLRPVGVIPVDLFGLPADYDAILAMAEREGLWVLSDAAQSFGASVGDRKVGTFGLATATSFFPAKPLGCYGDGGAILTDDAELAAVLRSLRVHGQGSDKYDNVRIGMTARLDTIQAAILIEKLAVFADEIEARNRVAARYSAALGDVCTVPHVPAGNVSVWAQYTILVDGDRRDAVAATLKAAGVPTAVYYPMPLHRQVAYRRYPVAGNGLPVSEDLSRRVLSLPMHPYLDEATQDRIIDAVREAVPGAR